MNLFLTGLTLVTAMAFLVISMIVMFGKSSPATKAILMMLNCFFWAGFWIVGAASLHTMAQSIANGP